MEKEDLVDVVRIETEIFSDPWPESVFFDDIIRDICYPYVAQLDNDVVGYVILLTDEDIGHLTNLAVDIKYHRKSIAKKLLSFILDLANNMKLARLVLEVRVSNHPAIKLYESFGFIPLVVQKDYYTDPVEDSLVMAMDFD